MLKRFAVLWVLSVICFSLGKSISNFAKDCGSINGKITNISISGSGIQVTDKGFVIERSNHQNVTVNTHFVSDVNSTSLTFQAWIILQGAEVPLPYPFSDLCYGYGVQCPIRAGENNTFIMKVPPLQIYPKMSAMAKFKLRGDKNGLTLCLMTPIRLI